MGTEVTTYIVRSKYEVQGAPDATKKVDELGRATDRAARSGGQLKATLMGLGGFALGGGALALGKKMLIDFNSNLENSKSTMAGLLMMNTGGSFAGNFEKANGLVDRFVIRAKDTSATMSDLAQMGQNVVASVTAAGGTMKQLEDITVGASVAAKALGRETGDAGREIGQMLGGRVESVDVFGRQLLRSVGFADYQAFNKLSEKKRLALTTKALDQPALKAMAKAQANSFSGVMSTLEDNLQITLGKVGLPLMKAITDEVKQWNTWIDQHPEKIAALVNDVGKGLSEGFSAVKAAVMWISDNRETLLALAKAALVMKGGSLLGDIAGGPFRALASLSDSMTVAGRSANGFAGAMGSAAGRLAQIGNIVGLVGAGATFAAHGILANKERQIARTADTGATVDFWAGLATGKHKMPNGAGIHSRIEDALATGILRRTKSGGFEIGNNAFLQGMEGSGRFGALRNGAGSRIERLKASGELALAAKMELLRLALVDASRSFTVGWQMGQAKVFGGLVEAATLTLTKTERDRSSRKSPNTNINIAKVEVAAKDPDRWIEALENETRKRARVPRRARAAMRGGGA